MKYNQKDILYSFKMYSELVVNGSCLIADYNEFVINDTIRELVDLFALEVNAAVLVTNERVILVPLVASSPFQISNDRVRRDYLGSKYKVGDVYLLYFCVIIFFGMFYDSYNTTEPVREFLSMDQWLNEVNDYIDTLSSHSEEALSFNSQELNYNWKVIIEKWKAIDNTNEKAKVQDGRTVSRISFLNQVKSFLLDQDCLVELGNLELGLSEKAKDIVGKYYMEIEYNRGVLDFIYKEELYANDK